MLRSENAQGLKANGTEPEARATIGPWSVCASPLQTRELRVAPPFWLV